MRNPNALAFALHVEGNSDEDFLAPVILRLIARYVPAGTQVTFRRIGRRVRGPADVAAELCEAVLGGSVDFACIHRDADSRRRLRIQSEAVETICQTAARQCAFQKRLCVAVVPVRSIESWAMADPMALCDAFGVSELPSGWRERLQRPEALPNPKDLLAELQAEIRGRRRAIKPLPLIAERLDLGVIEAACPSFAQLAQDIELACRS